MTATDIKITWEEPFIKKEDIFSLNAEDINSFYSDADNFGRSNFFFVLLNSYSRFQKDGCKKEAAYTAFNIAYYLFILLTPPASEELALDFIDKAIENDPQPLYQKWRQLILGGN